MQSFGRGRSGVLGVPPPAWLLGPFVVAAALGALFVTGASAYPEGPPQCPAAATTASFDGTERLLSDNRVMADLGPRPTASPAHERFIDWLERQLTAVPGMEIGAVPYAVDRWLERRAMLHAGLDGGHLADVSTSGAVPYAEVTPPGGTTAPLVYIPPGTPMASRDVRDKIVIRDVLPGKTPYRNFNAVAWSKYDPDLSLTRDELAGAQHERDFSGNAARVTDLTDAASGGAAGLIMVHGFPRAQVLGQYAPYEGIHWEVPAVFVGADEGTTLKELAARGGRARIALQASQSPAETRMLIATLPGASAERLVVESHTDGMNAVWDNGPIAMLALARFFAAQPAECRPRTLQFVFTTGHLYQHLGPDGKGGSAQAEAAQLDRDYDEGTVAMVFALEHLGSREYAAVPRKDGGPGRELVPTGRSEVNTWFAGESPVLVDALARAVMRRDVARSYVLRGVDAPGARIPPHHSFGGEGSPYHRHLIPTIAFVTGPWSLFNPAFGMEAVDGRLMRTQTLVFADLIQELASVPTPLLGGGYVAERQVRGLVCGSAFSTLDFIRCEGSKNP